MTKKINKNNNNKKLPTNADGSKQNGFVHLTWNL